MTRVKLHKHGLSLASDNVWCYHDPDGEYREFPAIVFCKGYQFSQADTVNVAIRTPAEQLLWQPVECVETRALRGETWEVPFTGHVPTPWAQRWLDNNAPGHGWETPSWSDPHPSFYFARRGHAVAFCRMVDERLAGIHIPGKTE